MRWGPVFTALPLVFGCAHGKSAECAEKPATTVVAVPADTLLRKFDPALRWSLRDKSSPVLKVLAELSAPLNTTERKALAEGGLEFLSAGDTSVHVAGDAQALFQLAANDKVVRIRGSKRMKPLDAEEQK